MTHRKADAAEIEAHLSALKNAGWLGAPRQWWPDFVFHFTDVRNAVPILTDGKLLARGQCSIVTDIASAEVIAQTATERQNYVRLYFRPRTPTQFHSEGIRPIGGLTSLNAHCPIPIFLLFDAKDILTRATTCFSDGNLASSSPAIGNSSSFFAALPFEKIYHDSPLSDAEKRTIVYHRHAEVLVPNELDLVSLKHIICRSEAEVETLRNLLSEGVRAQFGARIVEARRANLFFRRWTFVETASLEAQRVVINFNPSSQSPGPFLARLEVREIATNRVLQWSNPTYLARSSLKVGLPQFTQPTPYEATLTFDDAVVYAGRFGTSLVF